MKYTLYPDQLECVDAICNYRLKDPGVVLAPTGFGKSLVIGEVAKRLGGGVLILHLSKELLKQNIAKFSKNNIPFSVYSASVNSRDIGSITFATLKSIKNSVEDFKAMGVHTVLIDECDRNFSTKTGSEFMSFISALNPHRVIGLSATPWKTEVTPFGPKIQLLVNSRDKYYRRFVYVSQIRSLIESDRWTPCKYKVYEFNSEGLKLNSNLTEFTDESIQFVNKEKSINKAIALEIKSLLNAGKKHILVFTDSAENAQTFAKWLPNNSVCLYSGMSQKDRDTNVNSFLSGEVEVMFNYGILSVGFDFPALQVIIFGRPTSSLSLYYQIWGRGCRKFEGKDSFLFIDFGGNVDRFGKVEDMSVKYTDKVGYILSSGDTVLSDVYVGTKQSIENYLLPEKQENVKMDPNFVIRHGRFSGKKVMSMPVYAIQWSLDNISPNSSYHESFLEECRKAIILKKRFINSK